MVGKEILHDSVFSAALRAEMKSISLKKKRLKTWLFSALSSDLTDSLDIEHVLDGIYHQLDLLSSYKRRYKYLKFVRNVFLNDRRQFVLFFHSVRWLSMVTMNNRIIVNR